MSRMMRLFVQFDATINIWACAIENAIILYAMIQRCLLC